METFCVAVFHPHVYHRSQPATIFGRQIAFVQVNTFYGIVIKNGEKPHQVTCIVDGGFIQQNQVLVWPTTAYTQPRRSFGHKFYPGQQLKGFYQVHLAHQGWDGCNCFGRNAVDAHLGIHHVFVFG